MTLFQAVLASALLYMQLLTSLHISHHINAELALKNLKHKCFLRIVNSPGLFMYYNIVSRYQ